MDFCKKALCGDKTTELNVPIHSHNPYHNVTCGTVEKGGPPCAPTVMYDFKLPPTSDYDLLERDSIAQHHLKNLHGKIGSWGPFPPKFPPAKVPLGVNPVEWMRHRVVEVASRYVGLPYQHHHDPLWVSKENGQGIDCSNFSTWVYSFALGICFSSDCGKQADSIHSPGRKLDPSEPLEVGDLLYLLKGDRSKISHVVIYMGNGKIIDAGKGGVCIRNHAGWYKSHHLFTRRIIE